MKDTDKVKIKNRTNGIVGYTIPDMNNLHRRFEAQEEKTVPFEELRRLSYLAGGEEIIQDYLIVKDEAVLKELNLHIEPEYYYTEKEVKELMVNGSLDEFLDCLDFAPDGVLDIIKDLAVSLPLNDVSKRKAILDKLGFNVDKAIEMKNVAEEDIEEAPRTQRRAAVPHASSNQTKSENSGRRVVKVEK